MHPKFSEEQSNAIRDKLKEACKSSWSENGYKKTSVSYLCTQAGISKGAFYIFYDSKEMLFWEVVNELQIKLKGFLSESIGGNPTAKGMRKALKRLYREYDAGNWAMQFNSPDIEELISKLPPDELQKHREQGLINLFSIFEESGIKFKTAPELGMASINLLILSLLNKQHLKGMHTAAFDFLIDNIVNHVFEFEAEL